MVYCVQNFEDDPQILSRFEDARAERIRAYPELAFEMHRASAIHSERVGELRLQGYSAFRGLFPKHVTTEVSAHVNSLIAARKNIVTPRNHLAEVENLSVQEELIYLNEKEVREPGFLERVSNGVTIRDPLINCTQLIDIVLDPRVLDLAAAYLGCPPLLTFVKLRKSFCNTIPPIDTQMFHNDGGSFWLLKVIIYLDDVATSGGPFTYIPGSHRMRFDDNLMQLSKERYTDDDVRNMFAETSPQEITGQAGDAIFAEVAGFHKGKKPKTEDRTALIINFAPHPEDGGGPPGVKFPASEVGRISDAARAAIDTCTICDV